MDSFFIKDRNDILQIHYEDLIKYHGRLFIGGVAMAFKAMQLASRLLSGRDGIWSREKISFKSAMGPEARGVLDAVEMATRALTSGDLIADTSIPARIPAPRSPNGGKYYFEFHYDGTVLAIAVKEGIIARDFIDYARKELSGSIKYSEESRLQEVKEELAAALMAGEPECFFNWKIFSESCPI